MVTTTASTIDSILCGSWRIRICCGYLKGNTISFNGAESLLYSIIHMCQVDQRIHLLCFQRQSGILLKPLLRYPLKCVPLYQPGYFLDRHNTVWYVQDILWQKLWVDLISFCWGGWSCCFDILVPDVWVNVLLRWCVSDGRPSFLLGGSTGEPGLWDERGRRGRRGSCGGGGMAGRGQVVATLRAMRSVLRGGRSGHRVAMRRFDRPPATSEKDKPVS